MGALKLIVRLKTASQPIEFAATNTYEKGSFFCVQVDDIVVKYPIADIFSVREDYGYHDPKGVS